MNEKEMYTMLLEILRETRKKMEDPEEWSDRGICYEISHGVSRRLEHTAPWNLVKEETLLTVHARRLFLYLCDGWKHHSGSYDYPVPSPASENSDEFDMYDSASNWQMWDRERSEYAQLRWDLLDWAIARLEKMTGQ